MASYICNSFSLQMIKLLSSFKLNGIEISKSQFNHMIIGAKSYVGHRAAAEELNVEFNRDDLLLEPGDILYVRQITGKRLPEGVTTLPNDVEVKYYQLVVE